MRTCAPWRWSRSTLPKGRWSGPSCSGPRREDHRLVILQHHAISDGWSIEIMVRELGLGYAAAREGRAATLPPPRVQYADYAAWRQQWPGEDALASKLGHWVDTLRDCPPLELPIDRPRPAVLGSRGGHVHFAVDSAVTAALRRLALERGDDAVLRPAGRLQHPARPIQRAARHRDRHGESEPAASRARSHAWLLRQHAGPAHGPDRRPRRPGRHRPGDAHRQRRPGASGRPVRPDRRSRWTSHATARAAAAVPGAVPAADGEFGCGAGVSRPAHDPDRRGGLRRRQGRS